MAASYEEERKRMVKCTCDNAFVWGCQVLGNHGRFWWINEKKCKYRNGLTYGRAGKQDQDDGRQSQISSGEQS